MKRINVRIDDWLKRKLADEARAKGATLSDVVREALEEHFKRRASSQSCLDVARRLGLVGIYQDAPTDLSTNPEHMEGFGRDRPLGPRP